MNIRNSAMRAIAVFATAMILLSLFSGCAAVSKKTVTKQDAVDKKKAMDLYIEGKIAESKKDFSGASASYLEALQYDPKSVDITVAVARAFFKGRKLKTALLYSEKALKLDSKNQDALRMVQQLYQLDGRTADAAEALEKYLDTSKEVAFMDILWLSRYYFELDRRDEARNLLLRITKSKNRTAEEISAAADVLLREGYYDDAITCIKRIVERDPLDPQGWMMLGQLYEERAMFNDARNAYMRGLENNPGNVELMVNMGNICLVDNDWDCAIQYFEQSIVNGANIDKIPKVLCALYYYAGRDRDAEQAVATIVKNDQDNVEFYFSLGKAMNYLGRNEEAIEFYRKGFSKGVVDMSDDQVFNAYGRFARSLIRLGRNEEAVDLVRRGAATQIKDGNLVKILEASIYMDLQRYEDAILIYDWLLGSQPDNVRFVMMLGQAYNTAGFYDKAEETFLKVKDIEPDNIDYLVQLSLVYDFTGNFKKAEKSLLEVIEKDPEHALALNNLAYMYIEHDTKLSKAIDMVKSALELDPTNGAYYDTLGWGYYMKGDYREARENIEIALKWEDTPDQGVIFEHYGEILHKLGDKDKARDAFKRAIELGEDPSRIQKKMDGLDR